MKSKFFLTSLSGSDKSTVFMRILKMISSQGFKVGGVYIPKVKIKGESRILREGHRFGGKENNGRCRYRIGVQNW